MVIYMVNSSTIRVSNSYGGRNSKSLMNYDIVYFCKKFIEFVFEYNNISQNTYTIGRKPFKLINVMSLLVYGGMNGITSTVIISYESEHNNLYQFVINGTIIADRTLRKYRKIYRDLYEKILSLTLIFAYYLSITDFDYVALDGTILKALNSPFNILKWMI